MGDKGGCQIAKQTSWCRVDRDREPRRGRRGTGQRAGWSRRHMLTHARAHTRTLTLTLTPTLTHTHMQPHRGTHVHAHKCTHTLAAHRCTLTPTCTLTLMLACTPMCTAHTNAHVYNSHPHTHTHKLSHWHTCPCTRMHIHPDALVLLHGTQQGAQARLEEQFRDETIHNLSVHKKRSAGCDLSPGTFMVTD